MRLLAGCELVVESIEDCSVVAMLRPRSGEAQWLISEAYTFDPNVRPTEFIDVFGNLCQRFVVPRGRMRIRVELEVETERDLAIAPWVSPASAALLPDHTLQYLLPSRYCPSDRAFEQARAIVNAAGPRNGQIGAIVDWIRTNIVYQYGVSDASTDALGTMAAGAGVCRDYAHVGITLCRSLRIPARMVVGYLHGLEPMDMHAWFEAYLDGRWYTFDPTQSALLGGRIVVAYGRDAADVAFLTNLGWLQTVEMQVWVGEKTIEVLSSHPDGGR
ncbi:MULTISPECIES: transglutaminase family protein [unclassified Pseudoxanthomonas]|uniref:transglutaminase family protein n=1 Tax=unclassified Pseudoxanthomonas TaxID=2645906 RepID=UPI0008ED6D0F|nr:MULTISPECIES: transglutaminase family protein [unclassified Pseudoxanthomonas]PPJ41282.1 transglutaminase family protein [Pseudoxanthomonas sp. KAs_5_3]SFV30731.1 Transglutaminase-like enzyme, putative cysteine protease [Pseudoxanthomonas sp. YR558]